MISVVLFVLQYKKRNVDGNPTIMIVTSQNLNEATPQYMFAKKIVAAANMMISPRIS